MDNNIKKEKQTSDKTLKIELAVVMAMFIALAIVAGVCVAAWVYPIIGGWAFVVASICSAAVALLSAWKILIR